MLKSQMSKRYRAYEAVRTYSYETHEINDKGELIKVSDMSEKDWKKKIISEMENVDAEELWFIFHDKDLTTEGEKKGLHVHIIALFENGRYPNAVMKQLSCQESQLNVVRKKTGVFRYLTHTNEQAMNERKYRYEIKDVYAYHKGVKLSMVEKRKDYTDKIVGKEMKDENEIEFINNLLVKIVNGKVTDNEIKQILVDEFGEERGINIHINNHRKFKLAEEMFLKAFLKEKQTVGRKLVTVYIEGAGNVGKTSLAKLLCQYENRKNGFDKNNYYLGGAEGKGTTYDPFQGYKLQYSTLLDEYMPESNLGFSGFNSVFNNNNIIDVSSRDNNKPWYSDFCVMSKSRPLYQTVNAMVEEATKDEKNDRNNALLQVQRRIPINIIFEKNNIIVKLFNADENKYELWKEFKGDTKSHDFLVNFLKEVHELINDVRSKIDNVAIIDVDLID